MPSAEPQPWVYAIAASALVLVVACASPPSGTELRATGSPSLPTGPPSLGGRVVFAASVADNQDIYIEDLTSGQLTRLTRDPAPDGVAVWSPSGTSLAFVRFANDGSSAIHLMNADGTDDHRLTNRATGSEILPSWSPDGSQIAFVSTTGNGGSASASEIFTISADGTALRQLTDDPAGRPNDPIWSPDGSLIAFDAGDSKRAMYVMDPNGGSVRRLTPPDAQLQTDWPLSWSPDGSALAFAGTGRDGTRDVYVVSSDGSRLQDLTENGRDEGPPAWSPDGRRLAFWSDRAGQGDIYVIAREGGTPERLTTGSQLSGAVTLAWSPDGQRLIVWNSPTGQGGDKNYVLDVSGGVLRPMTTGLDDEFMALWRPAG